MADDEARYRDLPEDDFAGLPDEEDDLSEGASTGEGEDEGEAEEAPKAKKGKAKPAKEEKKKKKLSKKRKATSFIDAEAADEARASLSPGGGRGARRGALREGALCAGELEQKRARAARPAALAAPTPPPDRRTCRQRRRGAIAAPARGAGGVVGAQLAAFMPPSPPPFCSGALPVSRHPSPPLPSRVPPAGAPAAAAAHR